MTWWIEVCLDITHDGLSWFFPGSSQIMVLLILLSRQWLCSSVPTTLLWKARQMSLAKLTRTHTYLVTTFSKRSSIWPFPSVRTPVFHFLSDKNPQQHVPCEEYAENLRSMVKYLSSVGVPKDKVIFITPPPIQEELWEKECIIKGCFFLMFIFFLCIYKWTI